MISAPEILFLGCLRKGFTMLHSKREYIQFHETPWGDKLDEVLSTPGTYKKDGWTAVSFLDPSMDVRPGAWSAFLVAKDWTAEQILAEAELQWPEVCGRSCFPIKAQTAEEEVW